MRRHDLDLLSLLAGLLFVAVGVAALSVGREDLTDTLKWIWPATLLVLGVGLLVASARQNRPRDEVGPEGGEDGEVEQPGGGHDR